jgi:WD40-like Beta Propeller Repeat
MKIMTKHLASIGLMFFLLNACSTPAVSVSPTVTVQEQTPSPIRTVTLGPTLTTEPLLRPEITSTHDSIQMPLPDIIFNVGSWGAYPLYECRENAIPGKILTSQFPYTSATTLVADTHSSFYSPMVSPNGDWITYVAIQNQKPQVTTSHGQPIWDYPESDSIWIMRIDGSDKQQLSKQFPRKEAISVHNSGLACDVVGGIVSLEGWSADSKWITFTHSGDGKGSTAYAVNATTGELQTVETGVRATRWAQNSNTLALVVEHESTAPQIKIVDIDGAPSEPTIYTWPAEMLEQLPSDIEWAKDETSVFVFTNSQTVPIEPDEVWRLNIASKQWDKVAQIEPGSTNFGVNQAVGFDSGQSQIATCGREYLGFQDIASGQTTVEIDLPDFIDCRLVGYLIDAAGNELISFTNLDGRELWISPINISRALQVINLDNLNLSSSYVLSGIAWRP